MSQIDGGRQQLPDQLRGLALLGIVLVNMPFLALSNAGFTDASTGSLADRVTEFVVVAFAQGKFYLLFAFLFGYSLTLMLRDADADGRSRYRRRLAGLAVLGLLHAMLFFVGDILFSYAVLGLVLLVLVRRPDRSALRVAGWSLGVGLVVLTTIALLAVLVPEPGGGFVEDVDAVDAAFAGSFLDAARARADALPGVLVLLGVLNWPYALAMFCLGLVAGRRGVLAHPELFPVLWRRMGRLALVVGLPAGLLSAFLVTGFDDSSPAPVLGVALGFAAAPALTGGYVALAVRLTHGRLLRAVAPAGRMSLTGYLGESVLLSAIFCGWGLGLFGRLGAFSAALVALAVWLVLELGAHRWLRRFRYGPSEWLLRAWTLRRRPPLRREPGAADPAEAAS